MPRKRRTNLGLPIRVYLKGKTYYYLTPGNRWIRLDNTLPGMHRALADTLSNEGRPRLNAIFDRYMAEVIPAKAPKTQHEQLRQLGMLIKVFGHCYPEDVKPKHIADYLDTRSAKVSANREIALLSHVYRKAMRWGLADVNPCQGIERNRERPDRRYITDADFSVIFAKAPAYVRSAMELAYLTGQRQADILKLRRSQLQDEGIYFKQSKTGKELIVRWTRELRAAVDRALSAPSTIASIWVIHNRKGQAYTSSGFQSVWQKLLRRCLADGVIQERFTFRAIRAKARSDGPDKRLLGHSNPDAMARIYQRKAEIVEPVK